MLVVSEIWKVPSLKPTYCSTCKKDCWKTIVSFQGLQYVSFREGYHLTWIRISAGFVYPEIFHLYRNSFLGTHRPVVYEPLQPNGLNGEFLSFSWYCWTDLQTEKHWKQNCSKGHKTYSSIKSGVLRIMCFVHALPLHRFSTWSSCPSKEAVKIWDMSFGCNQL